jgi:hypothetical protein
VTHDLELAAIVHALKMWRHYLLGRIFVLMTDHCGLRHLFDQPKLNARKARWMALLSEFDFKIKHIKGKENRVVDALSRSIKMIHLAAVSTCEMNVRERVRNAQETDAFFKTVTSYLRQEPTGIKYEGYQMLEEGLLTYRNRLYIPNCDDFDANDEEVVVDMEGELISALEEIDRLRIKNRKQKQLLIQFEKDSKQPDEDFALLKVELEEAKKIEDILKQQLSEKKARCEALEEEVVKTRKELEKFQALYHQNLSSIKASEGLATILNQQRNPKLKTGLGYEEGSSSGHPRNKEPIKFVKSTTNDNNKPAETKEDNQPPRRSKEKGARTESVEQRNNTLPAQGNHQHGRNRFAQRRQPFSRYKEFFYGYCFYCSNFGHKAVNCSLRLRHEQLRFPRNKYLPQQRMIQPSNKPSQIANCQIKSRDMQLRRSRNNKQSMSRQHATITLTY